MSEMGLSEYCHDINEMNAETLIAQFQALVRNTEELKPAIAQRVAESRLALEEQYQVLFGGRLDEPAIDEAIVAS